MPAGDQPEVVAHCVCRPRDIEVLVVLARAPAPVGWVITAIADKASPIVEQPNGVVLFMRRRKQSLARAREAFRRVRSAIEEADFGRLDRLARTGQIDHVFFRRAFGLMTDEEALVRRLENAAAMGLWGAVEHGELTPQEFERSLRVAQVAFARMAHRGRDEPPN